MSSLQDEYVSIYQLIYYYCCELVILFHVSDFFFLDQAHSPFADDKLKAADDAVSSVIHSMLSKTPIHNYGSILLI